MKYCEYCGTTVETCRNCGRVLETDYYIVCFYDFWGEFDPPLHFCEEECLYDYLASEARWEYAICMSDEEDEEEEVGE